MTIKRNRQQQIYHWSDGRENVAELVRWMGRMNYAIADIADMVESPRAYDHLWQRCENEFQSIPYEENHE